MQNSGLIPDKELNSLICRTLLYVNKYGSYKLLKQFGFDPSCVYLYSRQSATQKNERKEKIKRDKNNKNYSNSSQ